MKESRKKSWFLILKKWGYGLCLSLLFFTQVLAEDTSPGQIVILGSIQNEHWVLPWRKADKIIKKKFVQGFQKLPYEIKIIANATQVDLNHYLNSRQTVALFWVGHSAAEQIVPDLASLKTNSLILDSTRRNVGNIFQRISSQLKLISVVGCSSLKLLETFRDKGYYTNNPQVILQGFDQPMEISHAIDLAIEKALPILEDNQFEIRQDIEQLASEQVVRMLFTRNADDVLHDSLQLSVNGHFVKVVPSNLPGVIQEEVIEVPQSWLHSETVNKIMLSSGYNLISKRKMDNGNFNLSLLETSGEMTRFIQKGVNAEKVNETLFYYKF